MVEPCPLGELLFVPSSLLFLVGLEVEVGALLAKADLLRVLLCPGAALSVGCLDPDVELASDLDEARSFFFTHPSSLAEEPSPAWSPFLLPMPGRRTGAMGHGKKIGQIFPLFLPLLLCRE